MGEPVWLHAAASWLVNRSRYQKRAILIAVDAGLINLALWLVMSVRHSEFYIPPTWNHLLLLNAAPLIAIGVFLRFGIYRVVTRHSRSELMLIFSAMVLSAALWVLPVFFFKLDGVPPSVALLYPLIGAQFVWGARAAAQTMLERVLGPRSPTKGTRKAKPVVIYGAGRSGVQLLEALRGSGDYKVVGFADPNPSLWRQKVGGLKVHNPSRLHTIIAQHRVKEVLLAMPSAQQRERRVALRQMEQIPVAVRTLPDIEDLASGRVTVQDLRDVDPQDLLGREPVEPDPRLMARNIHGKSVLVTGAGGSIGSELVRQILRQKPLRLVLFERGEEQLYRIGLEAEAALKRLPVNGSGRHPEIVPVLGSVLDASLVRRTIARNAVETVYHAAAFKHVPMLEQNTSVGIRNNTFGTEVLADAAEELGVERFVLISTDKAVRPTSIMGASKRLAEMILQARAAQRTGNTVFTMVRFGNVLDSSGSVLRRFREQIRAGEAVTVTHPEMVRYFMSIPEAAALVIQAGAMAKGGDVFVLDMGEPVKIIDLARSVIRLSGLEVQDELNPDGDIAIEYVGLRPGEKLHEELLLSERTTETEHPRIWRSREPFLPAEELAGVLADLRASLDQGDAAIRGVLSRAVEGFRSTEQVPDTAFSAETPARPSLAGRC